MQIVVRVAFHTLGAIVRPTQCRSVRWGRTAWLENGSARDRKFNRAATWKLLGSVCDPTVSIGRVRNPLIHVPSGPFKPAKL
jgi:hypothetical protein